ncbi:MAG: hypothetical protein ABSD74_16055 [Rhizomicrobium sp.]|jgi:hypothetical protein
MSYSKLKSACVAATALLILAQPTLAGSVPKISGKYALGFTETCQAVQTGSATGFINNFLVIANFDSTKGTVQLTGTLTAGGLVVWDGALSGLNQSPVSSTVNYSNTATTFTVDGTTYNVAYGPLKKGVAQSAVYSGIGPDGPGCLESGTAILQ